MVGSNPFDDDDVDDFDKFLRNLEEELSRIFGEEFPAQAGPSNSASGQEPHVRFFEGDDDIEVVIDAPQYGKDDITVEYLDNQELRVQATTDPTDPNANTSEMTFSLPMPVEEDGSAAEYNNGILTITLPKSGDSDATSIGFQ